MTAMPMFPTFLSAADTWDGTPADVFVKNYEEMQDQQVEEASPFSTTLSRLLDLLEERGQDEYGPSDPSQHAFKSGFRLIAGAEKITDVIVSGSPSVDSLGGIRVTWRFNDKEIRLICPSKRAEEIYIYQETERRYQTVQRITPELLANKLAWLTSGVDTL